MPVEILRLIAERDVSAYRPCASPACPSAAPTTVLGVVGGGRRGWGGGVGGDRRELIAISTDKDANHA